MSDNYEKADDLARLADPKSATEVSEWIATVLQEPLPAGDITEVLRDGIILCRIAEVIKPNSVRYKKSTMPFVCRENIAAFLKAASSFGVPEHELFETDDLFELKDPAQVLTTIRSLSRQASKFNSSIPVIGPKLAAARAPVVPSKPATEIPAWSTAQYGFISNAGEGVVSSGRRDIVPKARKPPPPPPKIMIKSKTTSAAARPPPVPKKPSIFSDDSDHQKSESKTNQPSEKKNISLMAPYQVPPKSVISKPQDELDPSIYAYDEFYDEMKQTEKIKKGLNVDKDRKPKYMNQLLESKKIRERDRLRAQDVKIRREREKEGDEFDDKEVFITPAYKALQEEMIKASEVEEKERESNSSSNFNRILLEKTLQSRGACFQSEPVQSAGVSNVEKPTPDVVSSTVEPETLKSGLNVSLKRARPSSPPSTGSSFSKSTGSNYSSNKRSGRRSEETSRIVRQYEEQQRQKEAEAMESRERMLAQVLSKSGSKQDSVKNARERYLERKKKAAAGK